MRVLELQEYAKDNGYDSVVFKFTTPFGKEFEGKFLDAYFGMVQIPMLGDGFIMIKDLRQTLGDEQEYEIIKEEK